MRIYIKVQAASIVGSIADFAVSLLLAHLFYCWYILANIVGNICGAFVQFVLSRNWAFDATKVAVSHQVIKYLVFWAGNILLQASGVYFLKDLLGLNYILSKTITSIIVGLTFNYFVQKKFVFAK